MNLLKKTVVALLAVALTWLVTATGCSTIVEHKRLVNHTIYEPEAIYIAYAEIEREKQVGGIPGFLSVTVGWGQLVTSRVLRCLFDDDNHVVCDEQVDATPVLNPHLEE